VGRAYQILKGCFCARIRVHSLRIDFLINTQSAVPVKALARALGMRSAEFIDNFHYLLNMKTSDEVSEAQFERLVQTLEGKVVFQSIDGSAPTIQRNLSHDSRFAAPRRKERIIVHSAGIWNTSTELPFQSCFCT
jgi:hypothetical protein